jgi:hypothetical protein
LRNISGSSGTSREHRRQQPHVLESVLDVEELDADVERVAGQRDDPRVLAGLPELVELTGQDAVQRLLAGGESADAHGLEPICRPQAHRSPATAT